MRKNLLFVLLCMHYVARGQTTFNYDYWFDNDRTTLQSGISATGAWQIEADLDALTYSFHTIHLQVRDEQGVLSSPVSRHFVKVIPSANEMRGYYWFDNNPTTMKTSDVVRGAFSIDVSTLREGYHTFHYQAIDNQGNASSVVTALMYKMVQKDDVKTFRCWFDNDYSTMQGNLPADNVAMLDVSKLTDGFHVVHVQADGITPTAAHSYYFIKQPQTIGVEYITLVCTIDDVLYKQERVSNSGGAMFWNFDISDLKQGLHQIQLIGVTPSGAATSSYSSFFLRAATAQEIANMKFYYYIDNDNFTVSEGRYADGCFYFDLDVSQLTDGLHRLAYFMSNGNGITTKVTSQFFWKTPVGGNGIMEYKYWLNEKSGADDIHVVKLTERTNPYKLISLLPVENQPIRSSCFEFRIKNGQPVIYAKNDIHLRFTEATGRFTDVSKQFVDEQVMSQVTDLTWIEAGVRATAPKPSENTIKWYCLEAEQGDSLQFKLDRAATIQLFSPSEKEVYSASGSTSVAWGGCHVEETGIYYLALHDVTAQQGTTVSIDYNRIGKYAIMAYTPNSLSTDGTTIMYLKGNGLQYVQSVELVSDDIILAADTIVSNVTDLLARFTLNEGNDVVGNYYLRVCFHNEDEGESRIITQHQPITLRQADKGDITVKVVTERRVGDPYPIKVHLKNNGNVCLYGIPVNIAYDHPEMIDEFQFVNFDMLLSKDLYENRLFFAYTDDLVGTGKKGFFLPLVIPYLGPNEEKTFIFGVRTRIAHAKFNFYAWAGDPMYDGLSNDGENSGNKLRRKAPPCTPSNIPDVYDALGDADDLTNFPINPSRVLRPFIGAAEAISGIIQGSTRAREDAVFDAAGIPQSERDDYRFQYRHCVRSPYDIARDAHPLQAPRRAGGAGGGAAVDGHANGDCPHPNPNPIDVYIPGDPNEITGYLAESGSHYITDSIKTVGYDIEFENDPELANSSAHRIVIENQLDPEVFDLSSFVPNEIKLSDKTLELTGETPFIQTIDLRPNINAIAQVEGNYDANNGKIKWIIQSLDPMTMEPTDDIMQGVLPINNSNGDGIGHVTYSVDLRTKLEDGTEIPNQATIVFDYNEAIETPTWVNTVDAVAPQSTILGGIQRTDSTLILRLAGEDERSGVWKYAVYAQAGSEAPWELVAENVTDTLCEVRVFDGIDYGFCVLATDSAGNVERKTLEREFELASFLPGDANGDGVVNSTDAQLVVNYYLGKAVYLNFAAADVVTDGQLNSVDAQAIQNIYLNSTQQKQLLPRRARMRKQRAANAEVYSHE